MHSLLSRVKKLEDKLNISDDEHLIFFTIIDNPEDEGKLASISDIKRSRSIQNKDDLSNYDFLEYVSELWDIDMHLHYASTKNKKPIEFC